MSDWFLPETQCAVRLVGPGRIVLDPAKPVPRPGPRQFLLRIEAVVLCFSDMKLLAQFAEHPRKAPVVAGVPERVLAELPSYVPGAAPTVPGHEVVGVVVAVGDSVRSVAVGDRRLVQPDFRAMRTAGSNGAFGYNFEGGLQEYVLLDERILFEAAGGEPYLLPADPDLGRSAVALVEPWACVENSYRTPERRSVLPDGRLLVLAEEPERFESVQALYPGGQGPGYANHIQISTELGPILRTLAVRPDEFYDDVVIFGAHPEVIEAASTKLAVRGIANLVLGGRRLGRPVAIGLGRVHYGYTRWVGTLGEDPADGYRMIPATGELRADERVLVMGAGGPMGQMHVLRALSHGVRDVVAADVDDSRLEALARKATPGSPMCTRNTREHALDGPFSYVAIMAPIPELIERSILLAGKGAILNLFAGIPAPVVHPLDLDALIEKGVFLFGTSGSATADMVAVYDKLRAGQLNTNLCVDAVAGMAGSIDGLRAVQDRSIAGKIVVYPALRDLPLTTLSDLPDRLPTVAERLDGGAWTPEAEAELLRVAH